MPTLAPIATLALEYHHPRIPQLDGLRAFAILSVFAHHALNVPLLWMGVDLFFVLSGFLITGILLSRKESRQPYFSHFYARRARRILPPYILLLAISSCVFGIAWVKYWYWYAFFATNIAGALHQGHQSLQPLWSLAVEEQFYLVWPIVILLVSERALVRMAIAVIFVAPLLRALATPLFSTHLPIYFLTPFRMDLLGAGALLAIAWKHAPQLFLRFRSYAVGLILITLSALVWLSRYPQFRTNSNTVIANTFLYSIILILVTSILAVALSGTGLSCRIMTWSPLRYLGRISYSMYLIYLSAIIVFRQITTNRAEVFLGSLAFAILYATVTWYGFEKRLLNPRKNKSRASLAKAASATAGSLSLT